MSLALPLSPRPVETYTCKGWVEKMALDILNILIKFHLTVSKFDLDFHLFETFVSFAYFVIFL